MIDFDTVHINCTDLAIHEDREVLQGETDSVRVSDQLNMEGNALIFTLQTNHLIDLSQGDGVVEITTVSKFEPHKFPAQESSLRKMIDAHIFSIAKPL